MRGRFFKSVHITLLVLTSSARVLGNPDIYVYSFRVHDLFMCRRNAVDLKKFEGGGKKCKIPKNFPKPSQNKRKSFRTAKIGEMAPGSDSPLSQIDPPIRLLY